MGCCSPYWRVKDGVSVAVCLHSLACLLDWGLSSAYPQGGRRQDRQSSEDEEDTGEREAKAGETRKELGDVNKSAVEGAPGEVEGWTKWLPGTVPTCRFYKTMGFTARSLYFPLSEPLIRVSVTIMIFLSRKIR